MRVVFDTSVWVSALLWQGPPHRLLRAAEEGKFDIVASEATLAELRDVLGRAKFFRALQARSLSVPDLLVSVLETVELIDMPVGVRFHVPGLRDPKDAMFVALASVSGARYLVSGDGHLLELKTFGDTLMVTSTEAVQALEIR